MFDDDEEGILSRKYKHIVLFMLSSMLLTQIDHVLAETSMPAQVSSKRSDSSVTPPATSEKSSDPSHASDQKSKSESTSTISDASEETASSGAASSASQSIASQKSSTTKQTDTNKLKLFSATATDDILPAAGTWQEDSSFKSIDNTNVLGIAGQFTIFAGEIDSTKNPVLGNFATSNFKTSAHKNNGSIGLSYLQNFPTNSGEPWASVSFGGKQLILGQQVHYENKGNKPLINGFNIQDIPSEGFRQDVPGSQFINIATELTRLSNNAKSIAEYSKVLSITGPDWNRRVDTTSITATGNVKYITLKKSDLSTAGGQTIHIDGLQKDQRVALTIDTSAIDVDINFRSMSFALDKNANQNILFNFYDFKNNMPYKGQIFWNESQTQSQYALFAPLATVTLGQGQFKGNIVANKLIIDYMGGGSGNFPDIPVPSSKPPEPSKSLISVPNVAFSNLTLFSTDKVTGSWTDEFKLQGKKDKEVKINLTLDTPFTMSNGVKADKVTWELRRSDYETNQLVTTSQDMTNTAAQISYWPGQTGDQQDVLKDWGWNQAHKTNNFYDLIIGNLKSVTNSGDYKATLRWTIVNGPS